jgi:hypothetical protein
MYMNQVAMLLPLEATRSSAAVKHCSDAVAPRYHSFCIFNAFSSRKNQFEQKLRSTAVHRLQQLRNCASIQKLIALVEI